MNVQLEHLAKNFTKVTLPSITLWFSYETPIAFQNRLFGLVVSENLWSASTGRHLNAIALARDVQRKPRHVFEGLLTSALDSL